MGERCITQSEWWQIIAHIKEGTKSNMEIARLIGLSKTFFTLVVPARKRGQVDPCQPPKRTIVPFLELSELIQELVTKNRPQNSIQCEIHLFLKAQSAEYLSNTRLESTLL